MSEPNDQYYSSPYPYEFNPGFFRKEAMQERSPLLDFRESRFETKARREVPEYSSQYYSNSPSYTDSRLNVMKNFEYEKIQQELEYEKQMRKVKEYELQQINEKYKRLSDKYDKELNINRQNKICINDLADKLKIVRRREQSDRKRIQQQKHNQELICTLPAKEIYFNDIEDEYPSHKYVANCCKISEKELLKTKTAWEIIDIYFPKFEIFYVCFYSLNTNWYKKILYICDKKEITLGELLKQFHVNLVDIPINQKYKIFIKQYLAMLDVIDPCQTIFRELYEKLKQKLPGIILYSRQNFKRSECVYGNTCDCGGFCANSHSNGVLDREDECFRFLKQTQSAFTDRKTTVQWKYMKCVIPNCRVPYLCSFFHDGDESPIMDLAKLKNNGFRWNYLKAACIFIYFALYGKQSILDVYQCEENDLRILKKRKHEKEEII